MPLLDHFRPPLSLARHRESFHALWAASIVEALNDDLPPGYFAEAQVLVGGRVEVDVGTFEPGTAGEATTAVLTKPWTAPPPIQTTPAVFSDIVEVLVFDGEGGPSLVAAIELVSPGSKDRDETRTAFAAKCASYLQEGIGLVIVDVVTSRRANLHRALMELLRASDDLDLAAEGLYAVAYRPARRPDPIIEMWPESLHIGGDLPTLPLALRSGPTMPFNLEATYAEARRRGRFS